MDVQRPVSTINYTYTIYEKNVQTPNTLLSKHPTLRDLILINPHLLFIIIEISIYEIIGLVTLGDFRCGSGRSGFGCGCGWFL